MYSFQLQCVIQAIEVDPTAFFIWYPVGCLSRHLKNYRFAKHAFENGIFLNQQQEKKDVLDVMAGSQYTPVQWHCFEGLCSVLYDIGDYSTCRRYIERTLENYSDWELGHKLLKDMTKGDNMEWIDSVGINEQQVPVKPIVITIQKAEANLLIEKLLTLYKKQHTTNNAEEELDEEALETNIGIDNTLFIHNAIKIVVEDVQSPETPVVTEQITPEITEAQKRKREDTDAITGEEEESDQDEAKKANLR